MSEKLSLVHDLNEINAESWNSLVGDHPLMRHEFLFALDQTQCAVARTGWAPHYLVLHRHGMLVAAMPLYLKWHSRGEYVFDYAWAQAFEQHGLEYYPKLVCAVPFSPVPGPRLLARTHSDRVMLARHAIELTRRNTLSSLHVLFPHETDRAALKEAGFLFRETVQFHWHNKSYQNMDEFLASMSQQKRKRLRQDRKKAEQAGITFKWLQGQQIAEANLRFFFECYCRTYLEHGNAPYLNYEFFALLHRTMPENLVLVVAEQNKNPVACALNVRSADTLYGRYWGANTFVSGLHFETCYMQGIEFCIAHGLNVFEGGAQGEHKLSRGLLPAITYSAHWIRDERYAGAIADFLLRETQMIDGYVEQLNEHSPFKADAQTVSGPDEPGREQQRKLEL